MVAYDSDMQIDFDDLRFTSSDEITQLNYWLDSKIDSSTATVWVKVPTISVFGTTIYMYCGNSLVSSLSNGANTFVMFDHFVGDTGLWSMTSATSGTYSISGGEAIVSSIYVNGSYGRFQTKNAYSVTNVGIIVRYRLYVGGSSCNYANVRTYIYPMSGAWSLSSWGFTWSSSDYNDSYIFGGYQDNVTRPCGSWEYI